MSVSTLHTEYKEAAPQWELVRLAAKGQEAIKDKRVKFLPMSNGMMQLDANTQSDVYKAYLSRAEYPNWVQDALRTATGLISKQMPEIELPTAMQDMEQNATDDGFSLKQMYSRTCNDVMETGRSCLLADIDESGKPYIAVYNAESLINWQVTGTNGRQDITLLVLKEQRKKPDADRYSHEYDDVYRVLSLQDGYCVSELLDDKGETLEEATPYMTSSGKGLKYIPAVITGSTDNSVDVDKIPLLTMAYAAVKYYQLSADYYQELHHTAHPQPYIIGMDEDEVPQITGAFSAWLLPLEATCGYLEVAGTGITAKRTAMQDQKNAALEAGAKVMDTSSQESGEARKARQNDQYASLFSVVTTVAEGVEQVLKYIAELIGANQDEVIFTVKPEFTNNVTDTAVLQQLINLATMGKVSDQTVWDYLQTGKIPERTYDDDVLLRTGITQADIPT